MVVEQAAKERHPKTGQDSASEWRVVNPPAQPERTVGHDVATAATPDTVDPQIVILGVAGSSPVSHPSASPIGSFSACVADVRRGESNDAYHGDDDHRNASRGKVFLDSIALYHGRYVARTIANETGLAERVAQRITGESTPSSAALVRYIDTTASEAPAGFDGYLDGLGQIGGDTAPASED